jgi:hypothetical protein
MSQQNAINNRSSTLTVDSGLTVTAGNATISAGNVLLPTTTSTTGQLQINSQRFVHNYGTNNTFIGYASGNFTLTVANASGNTTTGIQTMGKITLGAYNAAFGMQSFYELTEGSENAGCGFRSGYIVTTGAGNAFFGSGAGTKINTGSYNTYLGSNSGTTNVTGAASSNIYIASPGVNGESNVMRLGADGTGNRQVDTVVIAGTNATISGAASAGTVNIATGAGAKVVTLGSTNGASSLALKYGTADFTLASATGTVMSALDTGEITKPLQPCFMAFNSATDADVTGDATVFTLIFDGERYDQNEDWDGTSTFTAPVTGKYFFDVHVYTQGIAAGHTAGFIYFVTSNRTYYCWSLNPAAVCAGTGMFTGTVLADMDVGDTCQVKIHIDNSTKVIDIYGAATGEYTNFSGSLVC